MIDSKGMIVVILVALGSAGDPAGQAMTSATRDAVGQGSIVVVREAPAETLASHDEPERTGALLHADAVAVVTWSGDDHASARVDLYSSGPHKWIERDVRFKPEDSETDRGREVGFGIAAMIPMIVPDTPPPPHATTQPPPHATTEPPPPKPPPSTPPHVSRERRVAIEVAGVGATGTLGGIGGELAGRVSPWRDLALRFGVGLAFGSSGAANASTFDARADAGVAWTFARTAPFSFAARGDFGLTRFALHRSSANGDGARFLPGIDLLLEPTWSPTEALSFFVAAGPRFELGHTDVVVDGAPVDRTPLVRGVAEIGARVCF